MVRRLVKALCLLTDICLCIVSSRGRGQKALAFHPLVRALIPEFHSLGLHLPDLITSQSPHLEYHHPGNFEFGMNSPGGAFSPQQGVKTRIHACLACLSSQGAYPLPRDQNLHESYFTPDE